MVKLSVGVFALLVSLVPARAAAGDDGASARAGAALAVGTAAEVASTAIGVSLLASDAAGGARGRAGWITLVGGFAVAPLVAHAAAGDWARGLLFAALPMACAAGTTAVLLREDRPLDALRARDQRLLWPLLSLGLIGSMVGLLDVAAADSRPATAPKTALTFAPVFTTGAAFGAVAGEF